MHTYEEKLEEYGFIKISRSVMLNPRYIKNISGDEAVMIMVVFVKSAEADERM